MSHLRHLIDELIHTPVRLSMVAALAHAESIEFGQLRDIVEVSDSLLSKHIATLEQAGYLDVRKGYHGKWPRTWLALTDHGRAAYDTYIAVLRSITARSNDGNSPT